MINGDNEIRKRGPALIVEFNTVALRDVGLSRRDYLELFGIHAYRAFQMSKPRWGSIHIIAHESTLSELRKPLAQRRSAKVSARR